MILTPWFALGHLQKTGGDACKQLIRACVLAGVLDGRGVWIDDFIDPRKHWTFGERLLGEEVSVRVLGIRRLPAWEVSHAYHWHLQGDDQGSKRPLPTPQEIIEEKRGEKLIGRWLQEGPQDVWLRCEFLLQDLENLLERFCRNTSSLRRVLANTPTKQRGAYDHSQRFFTPEQIEELYRHSPTWHAIEKRVYSPRGEV
jgi:hypothetical protein